MRESDKMSASKSVEREHSSNDLFSGKTVFGHRRWQRINLGIGKSFAGLGAISGLRPIQDVAMPRQLACATRRQVSRRRRIPRARQLQSPMTASATPSVTSTFWFAGGAGNFLVQGEHLSFNGFKTLSHRPGGSFNAGRIAFEQ